MLVLQIVGGLLILVVLVVIHELGHAIVARRNGVVVEEFGIGFPPKAWGKKLKNGVLFTLNWLPLGGFVKLKGEHDSASKKGDYGAATLWQKTKILFAGVAINWLFAIILLSILAVTGLPKILPNQFTIASDTTEINQPVETTDLLEGYPAAAAGFEVGDKILAVEGKPVTSGAELIETTRDSRGETVTLSYERAGQTAEKDVTLRDSEEMVFGAALGQRSLTRSTWSAPIVGVGTTLQFTWVTFEGIGKLFANLASGVVLQLGGEESKQKADEHLASVSQSVAGPVGILGTIFPAAESAGLTQLVFLTAIISLSLAVMNALPIPALDGGRWFVTVVFRLLKKPLTKEREEKIQGAGFMVLMGLIIVITIADVAKLL